MYIIKIYSLLNILYKCSVCNIYYYQIEIFTPNLFIFKNNTLNQLVLEDYMILLKRSQSIGFFVATVFALSGTVIAAPIISIDEIEKDAGIILEGTTKQAEYEFKIKNTGDSTLIISQVRPGCGCTVVSFDSVIAPGSEGTLKPKVDLKGMRSGEFHKSMSVMSNASNQPTLRLSLKGKIEGIINPDPGRLDMTVSDKGTIEGTVTLKTKKKSMKISKVAFAPYPHSDEKNEKSEIPFTFSILKADKNPDSDGNYSYTIQFGAPYTDSNTWYGQFVITTNHPQKNRVEITGSIRPRG
jgi:hypothetical protein